MAVVLIATVIPQSSAQAQPDQPMCGAWPASIVGTNGSDRLVGTAGDDVIVGLDGDDVILGRGGNDIICGGDGDDVIRAGAGADGAFGGPGRDIVRGGPGPDYVYGDAGRDRVFGGPGRDEVNGDGWDDQPDGAADYVRGDAGNDLLNGGEGHDRCVGRSGFDVADLTCERSASEARLTRTVIDGTTVVVKARDGVVPDAATNVAIAGLVTDRGEGPRLCQLGIVFAFSPPVCNGLLLEGMGQNWAVPIDDFRSADRLLILDWPPRDGAAFVESNSPSHHGSLQSTRPSFGSTIPEACDGITDDTAVRRGGAMGEWRAANPDRFGGYWIARDAYDPLGRIPQGFPVLQVKGTEEEVQAVRDLLTTETLRPCVIRVTFSDTELRETFNEVSARFRSLGLEGTVGLGLDIGVTLEIADRATVAALLDGIDRRDLVEITGRAILLD